MTRLPRICLPGIAQHVIQRGNNRQICFGAYEDFAAYAHWLEEYAEKYRVAVHAWVFMTNHVDLLLTPESAGGVSRLMQSLGRRYVRYFNHNYRRNGTLWEGRFKSGVVEDDTYLLLCQRYIELNPVRAGMVEQPGVYAWSSYNSNAHGKEVGLCTPHPAYLALGKDADERGRAYRALFRVHIDDVALGHIRQSANQGMALGSERFKEEVAQLAGRRVVPLKRGPKPHC